MDLLDFDFEQNIERAETLVSRCYTDHRYLELEQLRIFNRTWQLVGRLDQVAAPGSFFTAEIGQEPVVIVRDLAGLLRGFHNVCRHRAGPIALGAGACQNFRCGYHGWTYALDGRLIGVPDFEGVECFNRDEFGLREILLDTWEQFIFAKIDSQHELKLETVLDDIPSRTAACHISSMKFAGRRDYVIDCNWKVYVDNYAEGYHVPIVHPSLMREIDYQRYRTVTQRYFSLQDAPIKSGDDPGRRYNASAEQNVALYFWVFPNLMLNIYPDNLSTNLIVPLGHDKTLTIFEWYFHEVDSKEAREQIRISIDLSDEIQREDIWICEQVQRGLKSIAYDRGRYSVRRENGVYHFHSLWMEFMTAK